MKLRHCASRRVEADPVLFASDRKRDVPKLLHRLGIVPIYLVLGLAGSFVGVLEQDTIQSATRMISAKPIDLRPVAFGEFLPRFCLGLVRGDRW